MPSTDTFSSTSAVWHAAWRPWSVDGQLHQCERGGCRAAGQICAQQTSAHWAVLWHAHREDTGKLPCWHSLCCEVLQFPYELYINGWASCAVELHYAVSSQCWFIHVSVQRTVVCMSGSLSHIVYIPRRFWPVCECVEIVLALHYCVVILTILSTD